MKTLMSLTPKWLKYKFNTLQRYERSDKLSKPYSTSFKNISVSNS